VIIETEKGIGSRQASVFPLVSIRCLLAAATEPVVRLQFYQPKDKKLKVVTMTMPTASSRTIQRQAVHHLKQIVRREEGAFKVKGLVLGNPNLQDYERRVDYYIQEFHFTESITRAAIEQSKTEHIYYYEALELYEKERYRESIQKLDTQLTETPEHLESIRLKALCHTTLMQADEAITTWTTAILRAPFQPTLYFQRGQLYEQLNQIDKARRDMEKAVELGRGMQAAKEWLDKHR
jgi:tetratricopeptide (TPR) repeat protein